MGPSPGDRARLQGSITVAGQRRIVTGFAGTGHWPLASVTTLAGPTWRRGRRCSVRSPESSRSISPRGSVRRGPQLVTGRGAVFRGGVRVACGPHGSCCGVLGRWRSCLGGVWGWVGVGSRARAGLWGRELGLWGRELERLLGDRAWRGEFPPHRRWFAAAGWPPFPASYGLGLPGIRPLDPVVARRPRSAGAAGGDERSIPGAEPVLGARWAWRGETSAPKRAGPGPRRQTPGQRPSGGMPTSPPRAGQGLWPCCGQSVTSLSWVLGAVLLPLNVARG